MSTAARSDRRWARSAARLFATQALFQMEAADADLDAVREEFETHRIGADLDGVALPDADIDHFRMLLTEAVNRQARIDQLTDHALKDTWPIARIDPTLRALFRAAGAELVASDTPPRVTITEFVEVARDFFPEGREASFVNGVLDHMARAAQPAAFVPAPPEGER
ncbi:MAG: transcription antitermination factor NusB [Pseudomonadota bacterium]